MKDTKQNRMKFQAIASWLGIALITGAAFLGTYYFHFTAPIKALIWLAWLVLTLTLGFFTVEGKKAFAFGKEARVELQKVVWPSRQETIQTTSIVMIMVAITGFILWGIDTGMTWAIGKLTHLG